MPHHDPVPPRGGPKDERAALAWAGYRRMMKWMALATLITIGLSLFYLWQSGGPMPLHMVIATILGVGFTVLIGTGLMGLVFVSNRSGHDDEAAHGGQNDDRA